MRYLQVSFLVILLFAIGTGRRLSASDPEPVNEVGIQYLGHVALAVSDVEKALHFYTYQLGLKEAFRLKKPDGSLMLIYLRVNDNNFVELFPASGKQPAPEPGQSGFRHLGLFVKYLQATLR